MRPGALFDASDWPEEAPIATTDAIQHLQGQKMALSEDLLVCQNADGGWSYHRGGSWTEPTCYALLALAAEGRSSSDPAQRGARWLASCQRSDGGVAPRSSVQESTWLTALALLLPANMTANLDRGRALQWVLAQTGQESSWTRRMRLLLLGVKSQQSDSFDGWPWYPGAAAWVTPTALSILALEKIAQHTADRSLLNRIAEGRAFLLARRCRDGGWNHGSTKALGYDADSYPESTGMALLALHGVANSDLSLALARGEQHLAHVRSCEAAQWLRLGLMVHGRMPSAPQLPTHAGTMEIALTVLADAAQKGHNWFLGS